MKKYLLKLSGIVVMAALLSTSVFAQADTKEKEKSKNKMGENDEVIIIKKGNKDTKVVVEMKDGEVTVNGKPIDEYKDDDVIVRRNRSFYNGNARVYATPSSPFRGQGQTWTYDSDMFGEHAYLGVSTEKSDKGAKITSISKNTAAEKAGLKEDDVITRVDETKIEDHDDLSKAVRKHKPDEKVAITYLRDGKESKTTATLGKTGSYSAMIAPSIEAPEFNMEFDNRLGHVYSFGRPRIGIRAQDTEDGKGVKVLDVDEGSAAEKAGIRKDDIITEFDGKDINSADQLADVARAAKDKSSMSVKLTRDGRSQTIEIKIPKKLKTTNL